MSYNPYLTARERAGEHLREVRERAGKTQDDYSELLGVDVRTVQRRERGINELNKLEKICRKLKINFNEFIQECFPTE